LRHGFSEVFYLAAVHRLYDGVAGREVPIQRADAHTRAPRDFFQADVHADLGEPRLGGIDQQLPVTGAVGARLAHFGGWLAFRVDRTAPVK
jgi:hypothetical protein